MNKLIDDLCPTGLEEQAFTEAKQHFAEELKQLSVNQEAIERLERGLSVLALTANVTAARPGQNNIHTDDGIQWHKSVGLMENICFCHRLSMGQMEYAVIEHFPSCGTSEICNRGWSAVEVLRVFAQEQRQGLKIWVEDMKVQVKEFLTIKYPGQETSRVADSVLL